MKRLNAKPNEAVKVGDNYVYDFKIPGSIGIKSIFLDRSGKRRGNRIIHDLRGLEKYLDQTV